MKIIRFLSCLVVFSVLLSLCAVVYAQKSVKQAAPKTNIGQQTTLEKRLSICEEKCRDLYYKDRSECVLGGCPRSNVVYGRTGVFSQSYTIGCDTEDPGVILRIAPCLHEADIEYAECLDKC